MKYYAGIDVSMKESKICVMDSNQKVVFETSCSTDPISIWLVFGGQCKYPIEVVGIESGMMSRWLVQELQKRDVPAVCICSRAMSALIKFQLNKTDINDARSIADAMRINKYKEIHIKSDISAATSALLNARHTLVKQKRDTMNTIRGLFKNFGQCIGAISSKDVRFQLVSWVTVIPELAQKAINSLIDVIESLEKQIEELEELLEKEIEGNAEAQLLQTIPGVGPITALTFLSVVDDPERFSDSRDVGAYIGLTPREFSSGEKTRHGGISKFGDASLRALLFGAATSIMTRCNKWSKLKAWGRKVEKKHGKRAGRVAVARKLAVIMHAMLISGKEFEYGDPLKPKKKSKSNSSKGKQEKVVAA